MMHGNTAFKTILADPPWAYGDRLRMDSHIKRGAGDVYRSVMSTKDICATPLLGYKAADASLLALWVTNPFLLNGDGLRVCEAWDFEPKQLFTWVKGRLHEDNNVFTIVGAPGMGHLFRVDTEHLIIATRGKLKDLPVLCHNLRNYVWVEPKGAHSAKPEQVAKVLECLSPGPYLELFARQPRAGWTCVGDEL